MSHIKKIGDYSVTQVSPVQAADRVAQEGIAHERIALPTNAPARRASPTSGRRRTNRHMFVFHLE